MPDRAGAARDEDALARDRAVDRDRAVRRERGNAEAGTGLERRALRQPYGLLGRKRDDRRDDNEIPLERWGEGSSPAIRLRGGRGRATAGFQMSEIMRLR